MPDSDLVELGSIIYAAAKQLNPFYNEDTFEFDFPDHQPTNVQSQSIGKALEATFKLQQMLLGPLGSIMLWGVSAFRPARFPVQPVILRYHRKNKL